MRMYRSAFPDIRFHTGEMVGVEPTGKKVEVSGMEINYVENRRISESWTVSDSLGLVQQLGLMPQPEDRS